MAHITISIAAFGWQAVFSGSDIMPNGEVLPLPFTPQAPQGGVASDLLRRFPGCEVEVLPGGGAVAAKYRRATAS